MTQHDGAKAVSGHAVGGWHTHGDVVHTHDDVAHSHDAVVPSHDDVVHSHGAVVHSDDDVVHSHGAVVHSDDDVVHSHDDVVHSHDDVVHSHDDVVHSHDDVAHSHGAVVPAGLAESRSTDHVVPDDGATEDPELPAVAGLAEGIDTWADLFQALSDPNRLRILLTVHHSPGINVSDLAEVVGMTANATSHALAALRLRRIVTSARSGRERRWSIASEPIHQLLHEVGATHSPLHPPH